MSRNPFPQLYDNEWEYPIQKGYELSCCDCGLIHRFDFKVVNGEAWFKVKRMVKATKEYRRKYKKRIKVTI